jgi:hypothetical protein
VIFADDNGYLIISLGDPDPDTGDGRIVAINDGVLAWLDRRARVLARLRRRGVGLRPLVKVP